MLVIRNKADIKIKYPIDQISDKDKILFFDIETTGFSRKYCIIYLIGCMYYSDGEFMYTQWLAENFNDEANVLMAFHKFLKGFDTVIHFNGNNFDIPFIIERGKKFKLDFDFDNYKTFDIYRPISKINHLLKMENQKQKSFEQLLGIKRQDPFSGGDLIEVFKQYVESKDERLIFPLLLHNREDIFNMGHLISLMSIPDLFSGKYNICKYSFQDYNDLNGDLAKEMIIQLNLNNSIPVKLSYNYNNIHFDAFDCTANISIQIKNGTYKYFYSNYKDYYYLPLEDKAIHKSLSRFVDNKYRKQATADTCYEKITGEFLPIFDLNIEIFKNLLKNNYKDKAGYIKTDFINDENIFCYTDMIMKYLEQKPKKETHD